MCSVREREVAMSATLFVQNSLSCSKSYRQEDGKREMELIREARNATHGDCRSGH
jgi:hypothetical protein